MTERIYPLETRIQYLYPALNLIRSPGIKDWVTNCIAMFPNYIFEIPSSLTGKYHPTWALGPGGLVRHTVAVATMAHELGGTFELDERFEYDLIVAAGIIHDSLKYGITFDISYHDVHMFTPRAHYKRITPRLADNYREIIFGCVERHMGSLVSGKWTGASGVKPRNPIESALHLADFVVSRRNFIFEPYLGYADMESNEMLSSNDDNLRQVWDDHTDGKFWWERLDTRGANGQP